MYICLDCGHVFDDPKNYSEDRTPGGAFEGGSFIEHYSGCPYCGGAYSEAMECQGCDEYIAIDSDNPFCDECLKKIQQRFKEYILDNFTEDEFNTCLDCIYDLYNDDKLYYYKAFFDQPFTQEELDNLLPRYVKGVRENFREDEYNSISDTSYIFRKEE